MTSESFALFSGQNNQDIFTYDVDLSYYTLCPIVCSPLQGGRRLAGLGSQLGICLGGPGAADTGTFSGIIEYTAASRQRHRELLRRGRGLGQRTRTTSSCPATAAAAKVKKKSIDFCGLSRNHELSLKVVCPLGVPFRADCWHPKHY